MAEDNKNESEHPMYACGIGSTVKEAEKDLKEHKSALKKKFEINLKDKVDTLYVVSLYKENDSAETKGKKRAALTAEGATYQEALDTAVEMFEIELDNFKQEVRVTELYSLTEKEAKKVETSKPPRADGSHYSSKTLGDYVL